MIVLSPNKNINIAVGQFLDDDKEYYAAPSFTGTVVDTSDFLNEHKFVLVTSLPNDKGTTTTGAALIIKAVKDSSDEYIALNGTMYYGGIEADGMTKIDALTVGDDAGIKAEVVEVLKKSFVTGVIATKELREKSTEYPKLDVLDYSATYESEGYTFYTVFENIDFEEVSDVTITTDYEITAAKIGGEKKLDLTGNDVNITIADDCALILSVPLIIGTPISVLGDEGSSIVGKVIIKGTNYLVAYADVDLTLAEIEGRTALDAKEDAVSSRLFVEEIVYATIFASETGAPELASVDKFIVPEIIGYNFTAWVNQNGDIHANVGDTSAYANAKAILCTVVVKYVEGVDYYMNGILFEVFGIPTDVAYGSYFTAKISDTSKYQGNPLINGEKTVCVITDEELVATGVEPIPVPPQPEPEPVIGDSGISLTDILLIVLVVLIAIMVVILVLRLNRS
jgi:hypothetical protein